jgi:hypothetical protein
MNKLVLWSCRFASLSALLAASLAGRAVAAKDLVIERASLQQIEDGPPIDGSISFYPGETVYWSFRIAGFGAKEKDEEFRELSLRYKLEVRDPEQLPTIEAVAANLVTTFRKEDKEWTPKVRGEIRLPDHAVRGRYQVLVWVKDEQSGEEAKRELLFTVQGRDVAPAAELTIRNFGFYRGENDRRPLTEAVYLVGDQVWTRFDIAGYALSPAPKNAFSIEYGLTVTGPDDKAVITQPVAATEEFAHFYPRKWIPAGFRLDLPKDGQKGRHELVLEIRDKQTKKKLEFRQVFQVE